ncbi:hypothetical protein AGMMS50262_10100 [Bacteroidia bacterium]|nr:hypothetical protein AGMMS50262_10100 [Bacteroidia bacterium]
MKKSVGMMLLFLIVSSLSMEMMAQKNLLAVVKKCDASDSQAVEMNIIRRRNKEAKTSDVLISIRINGDKKLVNEFLEAAKKDEPNTNRSISSKKGGKTYPSNLKFEDIQFMFSFEDEGNASITIKGNVPIDI